MEPKSLKEQINVLSNISEDKSGEIHNISLIS